MIQHSVPIFFGSGGCGVPAKIVDSHRSVRDCLIAPQPDLPLLRLRREGSLPGLSGLLLHDQEWLPQNAAPEVVLHGNHGGNRRIQQRATLAALMKHHFKKARVVIEGDKIKFGVEFTVVDRFIRHTDVVRSNEMFRAQSSQHCQLLFKE